MSEADAEKEGFLSRWSRRKRDAVERPAAEATAAVAPDAPPAEGMPPDVPAGDQPPPIRAACPIPDVPEIDPASLPPVESLTIESDFSQFLRPGVPTLLRNAALRRMWSLDPAIRDYIGPVDYQWDFNTPGGLPFGFANELVGDVGKLLAQAIGKVEELAPDEAPDDVKAEGEPAGPVPDGPPVADEGAFVQLAEAAGEDEAQPAPRIDPAPALREPDSPPVTRRRHGGALPA